MASGLERAFPLGHPASSDYVPDSPEAIEWRRLHVHPKGERDFPVDHPAACDTPGNRNTYDWKPGVDPARPDYEPFTGRDPVTAAQVAALNLELAKMAHPSPVVEPTIAPEPPKA